MRFLMVYIVLLGLTPLPLSGQQAGSADTTAATVSVIRVNGAISPTTTNYIRRGISEARQNGSSALIVELDTPGGLLESTKNIVQAFLDSDDLPIIVYVAPEGASAASAGTFITMAAHIAAMAPATNIGAASPVQMAPGGGSAETDTVMQKKIFQYSESYIKSIANRRGRNADWAISAVRDGVSVTADEALALNVIDLIANDRESLLNEVDGDSVAGKVLHVRNASIKEIPVNFAEQFFGFIMRPEVMLILTLIAIYGILGEVTNPGAIVPGMAGLIALILLLYASAAMPINIAGFALIGLSIILFIAEAFTPTFGLLTAGGAVSFFLGSLMLFQDLPESMELPLSWLIPATILTTAFFIWVAGAGIKIQFVGHRTGKESMIGRKAEVIDPVKPGDEGRVFVNGEYWYAYSDSNEKLKKGEQCEIESVERLRLKVKPIKES